MLFDSERAEAFNLIGIHFYNKQQWTQAIPFFMAALALKKPDTGFVSDSDYTWVPYDYLSICYDRLGDRKKSIELTLNALSNNPDKPRLIKNLHWLVDQL
jgi:tetratricopeptide (TPR) repeat protein